MVRKEISLQSTLVTQLMIERSYFIHSSLNQRVRRYLTTLPAPSYPDTSPPPPTQFLHSNTLSPPIFASINILLHVYPHHHTLTRTRTLSLSHTYTRAKTNTHMLMHTHTHPFSLSHTLKHTHSHAHMHTHRNMPVHTHTHTHTHTPALCHQIEQLNIFIAASHLSVHGHRWREEVSQSRTVQYSLH